MIIEIINADYDCYKNSRYVELVVGNALNGAMITISVINNYYDSQLELIQLPYYSRYTHDLDDDWIC